MRAADRFILSLLPPPREREELLAALGREPGFAWEDVEARSVAWGLAPLVHYRLLEAGLGDLAPAARLRHLSEIRRYTAVRNSLSDHALEAIVLEFERERVPLLLLKGADLSRTAYPAPGLRISLDLDLLVHREDVDRAEGLLRRAGYEPVASMERDWFDENLHHGIPWRSADGAVVVELHWSLVRPRDPFRLDLPLLWSRARPIVLRRAAALGLAAPDGAEYLAVHVFRHLTAPDGALRSLADLVLLLDTPPGRAIDWDQVAAGSRARGTALPLALSLARIDDVWPERGLRGAVARFESEVSDPGLLRAATSLFRDLFRLPAHQPPAIVSGFTGLGQERGAARIRFILAGLFPDRTAMKRDLSPAQGRWPAPLRYPALAYNYARELIGVGPRVALAAWRTGALRRRMAEALAKTSETPRK